MVTIEKSVGGMARTIYFDWLRILATVAVIVIHCTTKDSLELTSLEWKVTHFYYAISQWAVPIFVMISGALFLGKDIQISKLYKHSILHIVTAFLFWSVVYAVWRYLVTHEKENLREFFLMIIRGNYHMWFLFMIVGLYLIVPILNVIIENKKIAAYFLVLAFIFSFFVPQVIDVIGYKYVGPSLILDELVSKLRLELVLGYSGYFILGYFIKEFLFKKKIEICIYFLGICGLAITVFASSWLEINNIASDIFYDEMSINILFMTIAIFVFGKQYLNKPLKSEYSKKKLLYISKCTFGVYLVHPLIIDCLNRFCGLDKLSLNPIVMIPITTLIVFVCSLCISAVLNKIPFVKKWFI